MRCSKCSKVINWSPWDAPDSVEHIGPGIHFVTTPGHGGFVVSRFQNNRIPRKAQLASWNKQGLQGFYEEDCDRAIPVAYLTDHFTEEQVNEAMDFVLKHQLREAK